MMGRAKTDWCRHQIPEYSLPRQVDVVLHTISLLIEQFQEFLHSTPSVNNIFDNQQIFSFQNIQIIHAYDFHFTSRSIN